tara:strand:- start:322 stop:1002 length:681 start_codon:yes stop_codon:yes gene_type:complete
MKVPEYELTLSNDVKVKYRPFLVKEQKILLIATESADEKEINSALLNVVKSCCLTDIDVTKLPVYDFEYLWLNIRAKSAGEVIKLKLKCPDDENVTVDHEINIEDIKVDLNKKIETNIQFDTGYGVIMKVPTIEHLYNKKTVLELTYNLVRDCISQIYNNDQLFETKDLEQKQMNDFIDNLTTQQYAKLTKYFESLPLISHTIKYKNPKSGKEFELLLQGASDFFQ